MLRVGYEFVKKFWWVIILVVMGLQYQRFMSLKAKFDLTIEGKEQLIKKLNSELEIAANDLAAFKIQGNRVIYLTRTVPGGPLGGGTAPYVPPEGYALIKIDDKGKPTLTIKNKGFTFKPGIGILYSGKLIPEIDFKFVYWTRWSLKSGINLEFFNLGISRHIDDFPLCSNFNNIELQGVGGLGYQGGWRFGVGLRSNL